MEVDFTQYYITVTQHCEVTGLFLIEQYDEHAQRVISKVLGYFVIKKRARTSSKLQEQCFRTCSEGCKKGVGIFCHNKKSEIWIMSWLSVLLLIMPLGPKCFKSETTNYTLIDVMDLIGGKEIVVRAWTHNAQREKLIWNIMGMMNNCWFRVKNNICKPNKGELGLVSEHPTQPANQAGGWMARLKNLESSETQHTLKKSLSTPFRNTTSSMYSMYEVRKHNTDQSAWIVVHGHVYDCTPFLKAHPGGSDSITVNAGMDVSEEFDAIHSDKAKGILETYRISELINTGDSSDQSAPTTPNSSLMVLLVP